MSLHFSIAKEKAFNFNWLVGGGESEISEKIGNNEDYYNYIENMK